MSTVPNIFDEGRAKGVAFVALVGVGQALAMGAAAFATRDIFAAMHSTGPVPIAALIGLGIAGGLIALSEVFAGVRAEALGQSYAKSLRMALYRHMAGMSQDELGRKRLGALSLRFVGDLAAARGWAGLGISRCVSAIIVIPSAIAALYILNPALALSGMGPVVLTLCLTLGLAIGLNRKHRRLRSRRGSIAISAMERIAVAPALDLARRTQKEGARLEGASTALAQDAVARIARISWLKSVPQVGAAMGGVAILWTAASRNIAASDAAAALAVLGITALPLRDLADVWDRSCAWRIAKSKCLDLFARPSCPRQIKRVGRPVSVRLRQVRFRTLDLNLTIPAGAQVCVTGPPNSGKSALASLIASQNAPDTGTIDYGTKGSLPRIAYVTEDPLILQGSLRRALTLAAYRRPPDAEILKQVGVFGLGSLLDRAGGLDGKIQEGGRNLSASECLRVELMRAAFTRPDLIVIDSVQIQHDPDRMALIDHLNALTNATLVIVGCMGLRGAQRLEVADRTARLTPSGIRRNPPLAA